ncbi:CDP-alcohol phosphatidyltransferase family protein [Brumimicrobium glaciale]|uniref:CDP-alcohol phosphatidyltransferase family protein n=1 Tax=Brumimicrobium glaciale TaxID=200475 RepID=A0A4Q4KNC3_9FLAO|nr:CDP-alcohol phosphatidyltransferase family protein [Brumimicrobium glaciale]RYM34862.1 CDP-alcohol phosphatidyltransferase family protein [Brumimicrobium glaciale]
MSKLPLEYKFIDVSDYGRKPGRWFAQSLVNTKATPIHVTSLFIVAGLVAIACILSGYYYAAAFFIVLKSIIDASDGELARLKNTPSYTGRFYDSLADLFLNFLFLSSITYVTGTPFGEMLLAFFGIQLQGTLYNFYYVILRNNVNGDSTSRVFENEVPIALPGEKQSTVDKLYKAYIAFYGPFDKIIYAMDRDAANSKPFPKWFMTLVSIYGLGFQLLIMAVMLMIDLAEYIIPFLTWYSVFILVFIGIRKLFLK